MTFFRRISDSVPIVANQEPQTEVPQPTPPEPQTNFGIASNLDLFETVARTEDDRLNSTNQDDAFGNKENLSNLLDRLSSINLGDPQNQSAVDLESSATQNNMTVDASNVFSYLDPNAMRFNEQMAQLNDRFKAIRERRNEIQTQLIENKTKALELQQAATQIRGAIADGNPVPDSVIAMLGPLGILGMIGGLPVLPVIGGILGAVGLNLDYKARMEKAAAELEKRAGLVDMNCESLKEELEELTKEADSIREKFNQMDKKHEEQIAPSKLFVGSSSMVAEQAFQAFENTENMIQNGNASSPIMFNASDVTKDNS
jgi:hypothetical protein